MGGQDPELGLRMSAQLHWYALWRCHSEIYRWADASAAAAPGSRSPFYAEALASASFGAVYRGDLDAAGSAARSALAAAQGLAPVGARRPLEALAEVATFRGELADAVDLYVRAYDLSIGNGDFLDAAWDAVGAAAAFAYGDRPDDATRFADQASAAAEQSRSPSALALVAWVRGEVAAGSRPAQARRHLQQAVALATSAGSRFVGGFRVSPWPPWTPGTGTPRSRWPTMSAPSANGSRQAPGLRCGSRSGRSSTCWRARMPGPTRPFSTEQ
jgi:hypothetical protein